jgi:hypothetical protein
MPRKASLDAAGALRHIMVRGINRRKIFFNDSGRDDFLDRLGSGILSDSKTACLLNLFGGKILGSPQSLSDIREEGGCRIWNGSL